MNKEMYKYISGIDDFFTIFRIHTGVIFMKYWNFGGIEN